ncbi:MAG TPA: protein TolR [Stellaceae bacterium]|nr:protein TolR [Stellaceae bacterium]
MAVNFTSTRDGLGKPARYRPMSDINVTPMVDVMLVLLVIFMITAPLLTVGVPVDLPQTRAPSINDPKEPLVISIDSKGDVYLQNSKIEASDLGARLIAITNNNPNASIYVRGDKAIDYGRVMQVMGIVSSAGFNKVSLIAELPGATPTNNRTPRR